MNCSGFLKYKPRTETRENVHIMTIVSREPRQIAGYRISPDKAAGTIQQMVDAPPAAHRYCTDGYFGYLDVIFPGKHIFNIHNKKRILLRWRESMLIYGILFPRWRVAADVSLGNWKIFRRFLPSLFRPIIASAARKCYSAPCIIPPLFLSLSLISFNFSFGHSLF